MRTIPDPLRSGHYVLFDATYTGDVGSIAPNAPPVLVLVHHAVANVTVEGIGDPSPQAAYIHTAIFDVIGRDTLNLTLGGGRLSIYGPGIATVNLAPGARLSGHVTTTADGTLTINGAPGARLMNYSGTLDGGFVTIHAALDGRGSFVLGSGEPVEGASVELDGRVSAGETITVNAGNLTLDHPMTFHGAIDWAPGLADPGTTISLLGVQADSYAIAGGDLRLFVGNHDFLNIRFTEAPGAQLNVSQNSAGISLSLLNAEGLHNGSVPLPVHQLARA